MTKDEALERTRLIDEIEGEYRALYEQAIDVRDGAQVLLKRFIEQSNSLNKRRLAILQAAKDSE